MENLFLESGYTSLNKKGEELCGDKVEQVSDGENTTLVLADGLGSGVKANILATLTSKILCTMVSNDIGLEECVETVVQTLPVCKVRQVAYATFSVVHAGKDGKGMLFEFDNPEAIIIRDGKCLDPERTEYDILGKKVYCTRLALQPDDYIVVMSDGVIHAGIGMLLNFGWLRKDVKEYIDANFSKGMSARGVACMIAGACNDLYMGEPGDDTTVAVVRAREYCPVRIMVGPPVEKERDDYYIGQFLHGEGKKNRVRRHQLAARREIPRRKGFGVVRLPRPRCAAHRLHQGHRPHHRGSAHPAQAGGAQRKISLHLRPRPQAFKEAGRRVVIGEYAFRGRDTHHILCGTIHQLSPPGLAD